MVISLIGYRGVGKTTVARLLAERLGWTWYDADVELEREAGQTIKEIFATQGEGAFRDLEARIVARLAAGDRAVLALGGGAVLRETTRELIQQAGTVIWLRASVDSLWSRIQADGSTADRRPNLTVAGGPNEVQELLARREPVYRECSDFSVITDDKSPEQITNELVTELLARRQIPVT